MQRERGYYNLGERQMTLNQRGRWARQKNAAPGAGGKSGGGKGNGAANLGKPADKGKDGRMKKDPTCNYVR